MIKTLDSTSITIRFPSTLVNSIDEQVTQSRQNKTEVMLSMLLSSIPSLNITDRAKLPTQSRVYFVYTPDLKLLYLGKADNLRTRWNSHHKYQYFIESSMECRIGYFTFDSINNLNDTIDEFKAEPLETTTGSALVTADQFQDLKNKLRLYNNSFKILSQL